MKKAFFKLFAVVSSLALFSNKCFADVAYPGRDYDFDDYDDIYDVYDGISPRYNGVELSDVISMMVVEAIFFIIIIIAIIVLMGSKKKKEQ